MIGTRLHISYVVDETIFDAGINVANGWLCWYSKHTLKLLITNIITIVFVFFEHTKSRRRLIEKTFSCIINRFLILSHAYVAILAKRIDGTDQKPEKTFPLYKSTRASTIRNWDITREGIPLKF
jgi:hypothetical protein